jgi:hypothetical protein
MRGKRIHWYDVLLAVSASNLCFFRVWMDLLGHNWNSSFFLKTPSPPVQYAATVANVLLVGVLFYFAIRGLRALAAKGWHKTVAALVALGALLPLNALRSVLSIKFTFLRSHLMHLVGVGPALLLAGAVGAALAAAMYLMRRRLLTYGAFALAIASPLVVFVFAQAAWRVLRYDPEPFRDGPLAARLPPAGADQPRVVWVIFDELDYRLAFVDRPAGVDLPEFDRLRKAALFATQATSPAIDTVPSTPSLLSGRAFAGFETRGSRELYLVEAGTARPELMDGGTTVFSTVRRMGLNAGIAGFYVPYCRLLSDVLADCDWKELGVPVNALGDTLAQIEGNEVRSLFETSFFSPFGQSLLVKRQAWVVQSLLASAVRMASDPDLGLIYIHFPVPHAPHAYDRVRNDFTKSNAPFSGYADSLALADRMLGELRTGMMKAGLWDRTAVLVSSDHPYRNSRMVDGKSDERVPFLLKLPHQEQGYEYTTPLPTVESRRLVESILRSESPRLQDLLAQLQESRRATSLAK